WLRLVPVDVMRPRRVGRPGRGRTAFLRRRPTRIVDGRFDDGGYNATCMSSSAPAAAITQVPSRLQWLPRPRLPEAALAAYHEHLGIPGADDYRAGALVMARQGQAGLWERRQSMGDSDMHQRAGRSDRAGSAVFDLLKSKLHCPLMRPGTVPRSLLIERLARADSRPVVSVVAPPGYGKTTLLSQWAEHNGQS